MMVIPAGVRIVDTDNCIDLENNFTTPLVAYRFVPETKINIFVDMDGVLAHWREYQEEYKLDGQKRYFHQDDINLEHYFRDLPPEDGNMIEAVKELNKMEGISVYILSSVLNNQHALKEKNIWLDRYLPEIPDDRRVFIVCGEVKADYLNLKNVDLAVLIDDYTPNLVDFAKVDKAYGIKALNGINDTHKSWTGSRIDIANPTVEIVDFIKQFIDTQLITQMGRGN